LPLTRAATAEGIRPGRRAIARHSPDTTAPQTRADPANWLKSRGRREADIR
jgi:hypothetical protein